MKLTLKTKLFLSTSLVIVFTLALLSYLVENQVSSHVQTFFKTFDGQLLPLHETAAAEALGPIERSMFLTVLGGTLVALIVSFILADYITRPVKKVIEATKAIARGKYEERVPVESTDELSEMCRALNTMAESLQNHRYLQQQLITNVSHELATPLTSIGGYLEALNDKLIPESKRSETYALMREEVQRLDSMLTEVRSLSLLEEPRFKIKQKSIQVKEVTEKVLQEMKPQFQEKGVELILKSDLKKEFFSIDKDRYIQILINLLSNALKYSYPQKKVEVVLKEKAGGLVVSVKDEGQRISKKELPYIFERFYRADPSRNRKTGGIGIGLAIVKELVEAHGGEVTAQSKEKGGSIFTVSFPK